MTRILTVSNESTVASDSEVEAWVKAIGKQVANEFAAAYDGHGATAIVFNSGKPVSGAEVVHCLDDTDQAGALGYHWLAAGNVPEGFAFLKTATDDGEQPSSVLDHEVLEQLQDPDVNQLRICPWQGSTAALADETCDAVEDDTYTIDGVTLSNFVFPSWYLPGFAGPVDFLAKTQPLTLTDGGYVAFTADLVNWQQSFADPASGKPSKACAFARPTRRKVKAFLRTAHMMLERRGTVNWSALLQALLTIVPTAAQDIPALLTLLKGIFNTPVTP